MEKKFELGPTLQKLLETPILTATIADGVVILKRFDSVGYTPLVVMATLVFIFFKLKK